jgi:hypothetical protein
MFADSNIFTVSLFLALFSDTYSLFHSEISSGQNHKPCELLVINMSALDATF